MANDTWYIEGDALANGVHLHYYRTGGERPPVVLCHGFSGAGLVWTRLARALAADYDVIMVDARCHGRSEAPARGNDLAAMAADLRGFTAALRLERPAILGTSMGAAYLLEAAGDDPDLARAVILADPPWRGLPSEGASAERREAARAERRAWIERSRAMPRDELLADFRRRYPLWQQQELELYTDALRQLRPAIVEGALSGGRPWQESLARLRCPALLLAADPELGGIVTPELAAEAQRIYPALRVTHIAGAGHCIHEDRFAPFHAAVQRFIEEE